MNINEQLINSGIEGFKGTMSKDGGFLDENGVAITSPNIGVPAEILTYLSPDAIEVLTAPRNATKLFPEIIQGDWSTEAVKYRAQEFSGEAACYGDFSENGISDVNNEWIKNDVIRIQTMIKCGDLEGARNAAAKINLVAAKQKAAANTLSLTSNQVYMRGVKGLNIYGIMNHPQLPAAMASAVVSGNSTWAAKGADDIYNDIVRMFVALEENSSGHIDANVKGKLALSPKLSGFLNKKNQWGISVKQMVKDAYPNIEFVSVPEFATQAGDYAYAIADEVLGQETGNCVAQIKMKTGPVVQEVSSLKQKAAACLSGFRLNLPFAVARMLVA